MVLLLSPLLAAKLMGISSFIYSWSAFGFFSFPQIYFYVIAVCLVAVVCIMLYLYLEKGCKRYLSAILAILLFALLASITIGNCIFMLFEKSISITSNPFYALAVYYDLPLYLVEKYQICQLSSLLLTAITLFFLSKDNYSPLGDAHFATPIEIKRADLFKRQGILIGKSWGQPLYAGGFEHVLGFAPTGTGKTSCIAIPNLLTWQGSIVANDVKKTLWETTKNYRENVLHQKCFLWSPTDTTKTSHRYNPLDLIRRDEANIIADCQRFSHLLVPVNTKENPMWGQLARQLLVAVLLYMLNTKNRPVTLGQANRLLKQEAFVDWAKNTLLQEGLPNVFYENLNSFLNQPDKTQGGTLTTLVAAFEVYGDPNVDYATSATDFDISDLRKKKMTVYIGIPSTDMARLAPLLTIFWEQIIHTMLLDIPDSNEPEPLLCLIDEFGALKRMDVLREGLKLLREYRVRCILLIQQLSQLKEHYTREEAESFLSIKTKIAFTPDNIEDAEYISKLLGKKTLKLKSGSNSSHERGGSTTRGYNYQAVPLMRPEKIMRLSTNDLLVLKSGVSPIKAQKFKWYREIFSEYLESKQRLPLKYLTKYVRRIYLKISPLKISSK